MEKEVLIENLTRLHTTELGVKRIKKNIRLKTDDVIGYCIETILNPMCNIYLQGKNWYCELGKIQIVINAEKYTVITARKNK